jgi:hypothetical protein
MNINFAHSHVGTGGIEGNLRACEKLAADYCRHVTEYRLTVLTAWNPPTIARHCSNKLFRENEAVLFFLSSLVLRLQIPATTGYTFPGHGLLARGGQAPAWNMAETVGYYTIYDDQRRPSFRTEP